MARLGPVRVKVCVDASELVHALEVIAAGLSLTTRRTLEVMQATPRLTGARLAAVLWPGKDPEPRKSIAEGRLRAAAKAGYAHVAFEPVVGHPLAWVIGDVKALALRRPVYEISALGRTLLRPMRVRVTDGRP